MLKGIFSTLNAFSCHSHVMSPLLFSHLTHTKESLGVTGPRRQICLAEVKTISIVKVFSLH